MATKHQVPSYRPNMPKAAQQSQSSSSPRFGNMLARMRLHAGIVPLVARRHYTLRIQFIVLAVVLLLSSLSMMFIFLQQLQRTHQELNTIAIKSIPSVDAAQRLLKYVQDVDAKAADYIAAASITETHPCTIIGPDPAHNRVAPTPLTYHDCDALNIDAELTLANKELYRAIHNATYPGERTALDRIAAGLDEYKAHIMISRNEYNLAETNFDPTNVHLINAKNAYYAAKDVISIKIKSQPIPDANDEKITSVPSCTLNVRTSAKITPNTLSAEAWPKGSLEQNVACLTSINKQHLDNAYNQAVEHINRIHCRQHILFIAAIHYLAFNFLYPLCYSLPLAGCYTGKYRLQCARCGKLRQPLW
jgi:hypothetical protein